MKSTRSSVELDLVGTRFTLTLDEDRLLTPLESLWRPFIAKDETSMSSTHLKFMVRAVERPYFDMEGIPRWHANDMWSVLYGSRLYMVQKALENVRDRVYLHAAVLERDGKGLLLVGRYDSGKTSYAIELCREGWNLLSDDVALIDPRSLSVDWFPKPLGIKRSPWNELRGLLGPEFDWMPIPSDAFLLPADAFSLTKTVDRVETIVFLEFDGTANPAICEVSVARAASLCADCSGAVDQKTLDTWLALARNAQCVLLVHAGVKSGMFPLDSLVSA